MEFKSIKEIITFVEMTKTDQAQVIAEKLKPIVKLYDKAYHIYDSVHNEWHEHNEEYFTTYLFKFFNASSKSIRKLLEGLVDKRIEKLLENFDNEVYVNDIRKRIRGDLQDPNLCKKSSVYITVQCVDEAQQKKRS